VELAQFIKASDLTDLGLLREPTRALAVAGMWIDGEVSSSSGGWW